MTRQQIPPNHKKPGDREEVNRTGVLTRTAYERFVIGGELLFGQHIPRHCRSLVAPLTGCDGVKIATAVNPNFKSLSPHRQICFIHSMSLKD